MLLRSSIALLVGCVWIGCQSPELAKKDMLRDARLGCERGNGAACYHAGVLYAEAGNKERSDAAHVKGCALKHPASCDALGTVSGPNREAVLSEACSGGDLPTCSRLADAYPKDAAGFAKARSLLEQVCRAASAISTETRARDVAGAATACAKLAGFHSKGEGGHADPVLATKLDAVATTLYTEALFRLEKLEDARIEKEITSHPASPTERDRVDRENETFQKAHEAFLLALDGKKGGDDGARSAGPLSIVEEVLLSNVALSIPKPDGAAASDDATYCKESGDPASCALAAAQLEKTDPAGALQLHVAGCTKRPDQCWSLVSAADGALRRKDAARATQLLEKGCELKAGNACVRYGLELEQGERGIAQDLAKAARMFDRGCEAGSARSCLALAALVEDGRGAGKNPARAKQLHAKADTLDNTPRKPLPKSTDPAGDEQACRQSRAAERCVAAAMTSQDTDAMRSEELYRLGCAANKNLCAAMWSFAIDRYRKDDANRATRILEQGCQDNVMSGCVVLAEILHLGFRSAPRAEARAAELYQRACELGDAFSCRVTASRFRAVKNTAKADELHEKGQKLEDDDRAHADGERWAQDAADLRLAGSFSQDLARALTEWHALTEKARTRSAARTKRLETALTGHRPPAVPPFAKEDQDASTSREAFIKRTLAALFTAPPK